MIDPITASAIGSRIWAAIGIRGAIAIALGIALLIVMWRADSISEDLADAEAKLSIAEDRLEISNASIDTLEAKLAEYIGAGAASRAAQLAAIEAQAEDSAALQSQADAIRAEMAALGPDEPCSCDTPSSILNSGGL